MNGVLTKFIATRLTDLDSRIGGLEPGEYSILAGRPSMGKTALALEIACNVAKRGVGVLIFSLDMGADALAYRVLSLVKLENTYRPCLLTFKDPLAQLALNIESLPGSRSWPYSSPFPEGMAPCCHLWPSKSVRGLMRWPGETQIPPRRLLRVRRVFHEPAAPGEPLGPCLQLRPRALLGDIRQVTTVCRLGCTCVMHLVTWVLS
ncbi:MAG: hypothetical protein JWM36_3887 [Hyphomicrobiales bacterium]|nr:hypothetical protein [Hyphomicrobiales bacterium]